MAILEPALSETVAATCVTALREALDEAVRRGVPRDAAFDFLFGHLNVELAIVFGLLPGGVFSDAAQKAIVNARARIFQSDWLKVFERDAIEASIREITR
jgi:D-apionate oxidoisomerase